MLIPGCHIRSRGCWKLVQDRIACSDLGQEKRTGLGLGECYICMNRPILLELSWALFSHSKGAGPLKESSDTIGGFCALCNTARKKEVLISLAKQPFKAPEQFLALSESIVMMVHLYPVVRPAHIREMSCTVCPFHPSVAECDSHT